MKRDWRSVIDWDAVGGRAARVARLGGLRVLGAGSGLGDRGRLVDMVGAGWPCSVWGCGM